MLSRRSGASHCEARRLPSVVCRISPATIVTNRCCRTCGTAAAQYAARQLPARCGGLCGKARLPRRLPLERGREFETSGFFQNNRRKFCKTGFDGAFCRKIDENSAKRCLGWSFCKKNGENSAKPCLKGQFAEKTKVILQNHVSGGSFAEKMAKIPQNRVSARAGRGLAGSL